MAKTNPLDKYVTSEPSSFPRDFKIPTMPSLRDALSGRNLLEAAAHLDAQNEQFRKSFEQAIAERIRQTTTTTTTTNASTATVQPAQSVAATPASADLSGVETKISAIMGQLGDLTAKVAILSTPTTLGTNNTIPNNGLVYDIPEGYSLIVAGNFIVQGELTIEGILECLM